MALTSAIIPDHPPRVWGKVETVYYDSNLAGITPTCVGKGLKIISVTFVRIRHLHL